MKRTRSLQAMFASLLLGCGPQIDLDEDTDGTGSGDGPGDGSDSASSGPVSTSVATTVSTTTPGSDSDPTYDDGSCDNTIYTDAFEIPLSEIAEWLDRDGQVIAESCWQACEAAGLYEEILACRLSPEVGVDTDGPGDGDGDDGTPPPDASTSGDPDGGLDTGGGPDTGATATTSPADTGDWSTSGGFDSGGDELGVLECEYRFYCLGGRGHAALEAPADPIALDPVGRWAAETAHAEAASVAAFLALHRELQFHDAPIELQDRALAAARDEVVHARMMTRIAARRGARVRRPRFGPVVVRDLESIATENAIEGCVRETWAALEASHQARAAADADVRAAMQQISRDETRHAELAQDIDAWACSKLPHRARARITRARTAAVRSLLRSVGRPRDPALRRCAGLPSPGTARRLAECLRAALWA